MKLVFQIAGGIVLAVLILAGIQTTLTLGALFTFGSIAKTAIEAIGETARQRQASTPTPRITAPLNFTGPAATRPPTAQPQTPSYSTPPAIAWHNEPSPHQAEPPKPKPIARNAYFRPPAACEHLKDNWAMLVECTNRIYGIHN